MIGNMAIKLREITPRKNQIGVKIDIIMETVLEIVNLRSLWIDR